MGQISTILRLMRGISLDEMDSIRLMNRIDSKFLCGAASLERVLEKAAGLGYMVFEMDEEKIFAYRTMYFDTPGLGMYLDHQDGKLTRQKVRKRCYLHSGITFLEVKSKNNHGRTKKKRIEIPRPNYFISPSDNFQEVEYLKDKLTSGSPLELSPALETSFRRITLVDPGKTERTTIDMDLSFSNPRSGARADMGSLAVIELKQDGLKDSPMKGILLEERIKPLRISKYCIGTAMTDPDIKKSRFKKKLLAINKMLNYRYDTI